MLDGKVKAGSFPLTQEHPGQLKLLVFRSKLPKQSLKRTNKVRRSHHEGFPLETRAELSRGKTWLESSQLQEYEKSRGIPNSRLASAVEGDPAPRKWDTQGLAFSRCFHPFLKPGLLVCF